MATREMTAILLALLLSFGCTGPSASDDSTMVNVSEPNGSAGPGPHEPNQTIGLNSTTNLTNTNLTNNSGHQPSDGLVGKAYAQLMALGMPLQCDITTTIGTETVTVRLYTGTGGDMRTEMTSGQLPCEKMVGIIKGDKYYSGCEKGVLMPGCQWLEFAINDSSAGKPDYSNVPESQISCTLWVLDASKFEAPASACSLDDLMKDLPTN
jgi:hypothetical protein